MESQPSSGPEVYSSVTVAGDIDHGLVTTAMGVNPSHTARRGQATRPGGPLAKWTYWLWRMDAVRSYDGTPSLQAMVDWLEQRATALDSLRRDHDVTIGLTLVAYIEPKQNAVPSVHLEQELIKRLSVLNVEVEFDFSLLADDT